jgi:aminopeptidase YwaD
MKRQLTIVSYIGIVLITALSLLAFGQTEIRRAEITKEELSKHVFFLASEKLEGRRAGTPEAEKAALYIAREFMEYGLLPAPEWESTSVDPADFFQEFEFTSGIRTGERNRLIVGTEAEEISFTYDTDYKTLPFSSSTSTSGPVIFAGFGISAPQDNYDDYADVDINGSIVLVFEGSPDQNDPHGVLNQYSNNRNKAIAAREAGARALMIITAPEPSDSSKLLTLRIDRSFGSVGIPVVNLNVHSVNRILANCSEIYNKLIEEKQPKSLRLNNINAFIETELHTITSSCNNVIGYLAGNNPNQNDGVIIIGAHYDHLGWGGEGSMVPDETAIHYGADDNASGTAGLLELAQAFAADRELLDRSMLFIAFSAEELGLIGSKYYVDNPIIPLENSVSMINLDMIGRMRNNELNIFGIGTSPVWDSLITSQPSYDTFTIRTNPDGMGPSDHASFYTKDIPVLFFHSGLHENYHRPSDTADRISYDEMERIVRFVYEVISDLNTQDEKPQFVKVETPRPTGTMRGIRVYVGTMPDYVGESGGLKITGVREGSPAALAGIQKDDVIINFGGITIENVYDYTYALGEFSPGDIIDVIIKREGEEKTVKVHLESRRN